MPPKKGRRHVLRVIGEILAFEPTSRGTDLAAGLDFLGKVARRRIGRVPGVGLPVARAGSARCGSRAQRHELVPVVVGDPLEAALPPVGLLVLEDLETGEVVEVDTSSARGPRVRARRRRRAAHVRDAGAAAAQRRRRRGPDRSAVRRRADRVLQGAREEDGARMSRAVRRVGRGRSLALVCASAASRAAGAGPGLGGRSAERARRAGSAAGGGLGGPASGRARRAGSAGSGSRIGIRIGDRGSAGAARAAVIQLPTDIAAPEVSAAASPTRGARSAARSRSSSRATFGDGVEVNLREPVELGPAFEVTRKVSEDRPSGRRQHDARVAARGDRVGARRSADRRRSRSRTPSFGRAGQVADQRGARCRSIGVLGDVVDDPKAMRGHAPPTELLARDWFWMWIAAAAGAAARAVHRSPGVCGAAGGGAGSRARRGRGRARRAGST